MVSQKQQQSSVIDESMGEDKWTAKELKLEVKNKKKYLFKP